MFHHFLLVDPEDLVHHQFLGNRLPLVDPEDLVPHLFHLYRLLLEDPEDQFRLVFPEDLVHRLFLVDLVHLEFLEDLADHFLLVFPEDLVHLEDLVQNYHQLYNTMLKDHMKVRQDILRMFLSRFFHCHLLLEVLVHRLFLEDQSRLEFPEVLSRLEFPEVQSHLVFLEDLVHHQFLGNHQHLEDQFHLEFPEGLVYLEHHQFLGNRLHLVVQSLLEFPEVQFHLEFPVLHHIPEDLVLLYLGYTLAQLSYSLRQCSLLPALAVQGLTLAAHTKLHETDMHPVQQDLEDLAQIYVLVQLHSKNHLSEFHSTLLLLFLHKESFHKHQPKVHCIVHRSQCLEMLFHTYKNIRFLRCLLTCQRYIPVNPMLK